MRKYAKAASFYTLGLNRYTASSWSLSRILKFINPMNKNSIRKLPYLIGGKANNTPVWFRFKKNQVTKGVTFTNPNALWTETLNYNFNLQTLSQFNSMIIYCNMSTLSFFKEHLTSPSTSTLTPLFHLTNNSINLTNHLLAAKPSQRGSFQLSSLTSNDNSPMAFFYYNLAKVSSLLNVFFVKRANTKLKNFRLINKKVGNLKSLKLLNFHQIITKFNRIFKSHFRTKKPFVYTTYLLSKDFIRSKAVRKLVPDLPMALRGTFVLDVKQSTLVNLSELSENNSTYELNRVQIPQSSLKRSLFSSYNFKLLPKPKSTPIINIGTLNSWKRRYGLTRRLPLKPFKKTLVSKNFTKSLKKVRRPRPINIKMLNKKMKRAKDLKKLQKNKRKHSLKLYRKLRFSLRRLRRLKAKVRRKTKRFLRKYVFTKRSRSYAAKRRKNQVAWFKQLVKKNLLKEMPYWLPRSVLSTLKRKYQNSHLNNIKFEKRNSEIVNLAQQTKLNFGRFVTVNWRNSLIATNQLRLTRTKSANFAATPLADKFPPIKKLQSLKPSLLLPLGLSTPILFQVWSSVFLLKYTMANKFFTVNLTGVPNFMKISDVVQHQLKSYFFTEQSDQLEKLNVWTVPRVNYTLRKKLLRVSNINAFSTTVNHLYYHTLTRFVENCTGRKVAFYIGPFVNETLTFEDKAFCSLWAGRVKGFQRILGHKIFAVEALDILASALRLKDPTFLANWIRAMLKRLSFWKLRLLFRYLKFLLMHLFRQRFDKFLFKGFKLRLKGKISVAGNARTRALHLRVGDTSYTKMSNRVAYDLSYVGTFTGVLGLKLWFFF